MFNRFTRDKKFNILKKKRLGTGEFQSGSGLITNIETNKNKEITDSISNLLDLDKTEPEDIITENIDAFIPDDTAEVAQSGRGHKKKIDRTPKIERDPAFEFRRRLLLRREFTR